MIVAVDAKGHPERNILLGLINLALAGVLWTVAGLALEDGVVVGNWVVFIGVVSLFWLGVIQVIAGMGKTIIASLSHHTESPRRSDAEIAAECQTLKLKLSGLALEKSQVEVELEGLEWRRASLESQIDHWIAG